MARTPFQFAHHSVLPAVQNRTNRRWLASALVGLWLLLAWPVLSDAWRVNQAGLLLNRYETTRETDLVEQAARLLDEARDPNGTSFWRTYGAIATRAPSEKAYEVLLRAHERDELERIGELWLAETASATGHWEQATEAYARVDATNVLLERGDAAFKQGDRERARHWYGAAARSEIAQMEREEGSPGDPRPPGAVVAAPLDAREGHGARALSLLRIGRGLLAVDALEEALPVFELAYSQMLDDPPGTRELQAIRFNLATVLVRQARVDAGADRGETGDLPADGGLPAAGRLPANGGLPAEVSGRVELLVNDALTVDETAAAHLQAGDIRMLLGDTAAAAAHYNEAIRLDIRLPDAHLRLADVQREAGFSWLARETLAKGHAALPADPGLAAAWAIESYRTLPPAQALPDLQEAAGTESRDPYLFGYLGDTYRRMSRFDDALQAYEEGLKRSPGAPPLEERLARLVAEMEGWPLP